MKLSVGFPFGALAALVAAPVALAHSSISPPVAKANTLQQFTLEVQAEKEGATTNRIEITIPEGFDVETFAAAPGWKRQAVSAGSGEEQHAQRVVWTGGESAPREDPVFHFTGTLQSARTFAVEVRQTYSDGSVVDWAGPRASEHPAAYVEGFSSIGGGGSSTLAIVALIVGALGVLLGIVALAIASGRRTLT